MFSPPALWQVKPSARLPPMKNWRRLRKNFATRKINIYIALHEMAQIRKDGLCLSVLRTQLL
jgi:hypothetical protein